MWDSNLQKVGYYSLLNIQGFQISEFLRWLFFRWIFFKWIFSRWTFSVGPFSLEFFSNGLFPVGLFSVRLVFYLQIKHRTIINFSEILGADIIRHIMALIHHSHMTDR